MPGLLDGSSGLLGGLRQIAGGPNYGGMAPQSGYMGGLQQIAMGMATEEDRREYEAVKAKGYTGTFEEFMQEKRKRAMGQPRMMGGY